MEKRVGYVAASDRVVDVSSEEWDGIMEDQATFDGYRRLRHRFMHYIVDINPAKPGC